jgi:hypothetical protein
MGLKTLTQGNISQTLAQWQAATSLDAHSVNSNPLLTATYGIAATSPARNAGTSIWTYAAYPGDFYGNKIYGSAPDIGAVEKKQFIFDGDEMLPKKCKSTNAACYVQP